MTLIVVRNSICAVAAALVFAAPALAAPPYSQDFPTSNAFWRQATSNTPVLGWQSTDGPDSGAFVRATSATITGTPILFRANTDFANIDTSFAGDWVSAGANQISAYVRHSAPAAIPFFARMTQTGTNNPGMFFKDSVLVQPNTWTQIFFDVTSGSPQFLNPEGGDYATIMSDMGNLQFGPWYTGTSVAAGTYTYDLDKVNISVAPEPATGVLAVMTVATLGWMARRRK